MTDPQPASRAATDQLLDLLLDALLERQAQRGGPPPAESSHPDDTQRGGVQPLAVSSPFDDPHRRGVPISGNFQPKIVNAPTTAAEPLNDLPSNMPAEAQRPASPLPSSHLQPPASHLPLPTSHLSRTLGRMWVLLAALVVLVNVPLGAGGLNLAHLVPSTASLIIRDGLVLKGPGREIYVMQNDKLRWITSLDAFQFFGYRWDQVHVVDQAFLDQFQTGAPLSVLLKCDASPHIYALENDHKRWIKDIATFTAQGFVWTDVKLVDCAYLRGLPNGTPIPADAGPPPEP